MTLKEIEQQFAARGFTRDTASYSEWGGFFRRVETTRPCICNNIDQLYVNYSRYGYDRPYSFTLSIRGQIPVAERWADLRIYGVGAPEIFEHLSAFEAALIRAWEAIA